MGARELIDTGFEAGLRVRKRESRQVNPQASIVRDFNIRDERQTQAWNEFLNSLGQQNRGTGTVRNLGQVGVTFIDTEQMGRMFTAKYPDTTPRKLAGRMRSLQRDFLGYTRMLSSRTIELTQYPDVLIDPRGITSWLDGDFDVNDVLVPSDGSTTNLAFPFRPGANSVLNEEKAEVVDFFRSSGFDTRNLDRSPFHLSVIETVYSIGDVAVSQAKTPVPQSASLLLPKMHVFNNTPPQY